MLKNLNKFIAGTVIGTMLVFFLLVVHALRQVMLVRGWMPQSRCKVMN